MHRHALLITALLLSCTGCLMPSELLGPELPAGTYYVEQQNGKTLALDQEWVEVSDSNWFTGAGLYELNEGGEWRLDAEATAALEDQSQQLVNDARPASPGR